MKIPFKRLRTKLLASMLGIVALLTVATLAVVKSRMSSHVMTDLSERLQDESRLYEKVLQMRILQSRQSANLVAEQASLKAMMSTNDRVTVQDASENLFQTSGADLFALLNPNGEMLAFHAKSPDIPVTAVKNLFTGASDQDHDWWYAGGHLFQVSFAPITSGAGNEKRLLGRIAIARDMASDDNENAQAFPGTLLAFEGDGKILHSSMPGMMQMEFESWMKSRKELDPNSELMDLQHERHVAHYATLNASHPVRVFFIRSYDQATSFLGVIDRLLIFLGIGAIVIASGLVFALSRQITRPLERLADGVQQMEMGRFDFDLHAEGEDEVAALTRSFDQMRKNLVDSRDGMLRSARLEAVGRLAGGVAHDFNNLVTIISGYSDLLLDHATEQNRPFIEEIKRAGQRATALTRQLLAFSRKQVMEPQVLDPNQSVRHMVKMLTVLIGEDVELITNLSEKTGRVLIDPGQLEQVIMNLAINARDAMPDGGKLILETQQVELDAEYAAQHVEVMPGVYIQLAVTDTGLGIKPDHLAHIFEPFFTTKEMGKGTGLGLATVYGIVKQCNGHISVYSELGVGTTFKIYLPSLDKNIPVAPAISAGTAAPRGEGVVLLVEDEPALRLLAAESLKRLGYSVLQAGNGLEGLAVAEQFAGTIDIVLSDIVMPRMGGPEFIRLLKEKRPEVAVVFMSGYTETPVQQIQNVSPDSILLQKPFTTESLGRSMSDVQQRKGSRSSL